MTRLLSRLVVAVLLPVAALAAAPIDEALRAALIKDGFAESQLQSLYNNCDGKDPVDTYCFRYRMRQENLRMEAILGEIDLLLRKDGGDDAWNRIASAQVAWEAYRERHCTFWKEIAETTYFEAANWFSCLYTETKARADALDEIRAALPK